MTHHYDHELIARTHAGQLLVRSGEDPLAVLAAIVWPSPQALEREQELRREREDEEAQPCAG